MDKKSIKKLAKKFLKTCAVLLYNALVKKKKKNSGKGAINEPEEN